MTQQEILTAIDNGSTLYSGLFGFWLINPIDSRCTNVHNGAAKALVRRKLIKKINSDQWIKQP